MELSPQLALLVLQGAGLSYPFGFFNRQKDVNYLVVLRNRRTEGLNINDVQNQMPAMARVLFYHRAAGN